ncbi:TIGR03857 family LLM class F420-dependent oxidoreductase [Pseudonocardia petroleophila]|uniref:TIGR03857 family LLM class F420-dependent oxidoreductase n=1 Tax=Pseudonocardia petroleophila TaxID=37331 RepID=A0A7G7MCK7_9PSEU|nr:TIGR03857 family LLM class F420-dependent oxidoreductase [Pseudonocardia petroleophila]QNG50518.1 TIGR03857 family LLM class F420-dependent oxidoreductase [Pseudonocardia petroleophila]
MHDDLGVYVLPGRAPDPSAVLGEARDAERAGFGTVWVSERLDVKDAGVVCGAVAATTTRTRVATGVVHQGTRHPLTLASMAATAHTLSGGRFVLGLGRGMGALAPSLGVPQPTLAGLEHLVSVLRRLWTGERVTEEGPAGSFRGMRFSDLPPHGAPPVVLGTIGPRGLELAGRAFDGVLLHPFLTADAVAASVATVRRAAERAGRDPSSVHVVTTLVAAPDLPPERVDLAVRARAVSYFQVRGLGELLVGRNGWDARVLERLRAHPSLAGGGIADTAFTRDRLVASAEVLPEAWFTEGAAIGTSAQCAARGVQYRAAGADEVLVHGASPAEATGLAAAWETCMAATGNRRGGPS